MIADYYFENMIDEPKVSDMTNIGNTLVLYGDDVTFEIKDYYGEVIDNYDEWKRQREEYIENLYKELKNRE